MAKCNTFGGLTIRETLKMRFKHFLSCPLNAFSGFGKCLKGQCNTHGGLTLGEPSISILDSPLNAFW